MHDIRDSIPKTDQTSIGKFPQYEYREFPKIPKDENGNSYLKADKSAVVVNSAKEEAEFHADPKRFGAVIKTPVPSVASLSQESEEVKAMRAELDALRAEKEPKRRGRPAKIEDAA